MRRANPQLSDWRNLERVLSSAKESETLLVCSQRGLEQLQGVLPNLNEYQISHSESSEFPAAYGPMVAQRVNEFDRLIAIGGGSAIDSAKVVISKARRRPEFWAIPTTAGSGSEVTSFATIWDFESRKKNSIQSPRLLPDFVIYDSRLLASLPFDTFLASVLDATCHAWDSLLSRKQNTVSQELAVTALNSQVKVLESVLETWCLPPNHLLEMALTASRKAGMAINITKTSLTHSLSYGLTLDYGVKHGFAAFLFLPAMLRKFGGTVGQTNLNLEWWVNNTTAVLERLLSHGQAYRNANGGEVSRGHDDSKREANFAFSTDEESIEEILHEGQRLLTSSYR